jgi:SAM-dependent methyltransferase
MQPKRDVETRWSLRQFMRRRTWRGKEILRQLDTPDLYYVAQYRREVSAILAAAASNSNKERLRFGHLGSGHDLNQMLSLFTEPDLHRWHVTAIDLDQEALERYGRTFAGNKSALNANLEQLPLESGTFDVVIAELVLEHLQNPKAVFKEIARILAPGGRFIFVTPNRWGIYALLSSIIPFTLRRMVAEQVYNRKLDDMFPTLYRVNTIGDVRRACGLHLEVEQLYMWDNFPFFVLPFHSITRLTANYITFTSKHKRLEPLRGTIIGVLTKV